jgi:hypothetical protein
MRSSIIVILLLVSSLTGFTQTLTKSETITYLGVRLAETKDLQLHFNADLTYTLSNTKCWENPNYPGKFCFSYNRTFSDGRTDQLEYIFDPMQIVDITPVTNTYNDAVALVNINLVGATLILKQTTKGVVTPLNGQRFPFPYLRAEKLNLERVQKALLHLKKLYTEGKARDPFLN